MKTKSVAKRKQKQEVPRDWRGRKRDTASSTLSTPDPLRNTASEQGLPCPPRQRRRTACRDRAIGLTDKGRAVIVLLARRPGAAQPGLKQWLRPTAQEGALSGNGNNRFPSQEAHPVP
ncbi:hypothetical protein AAFF_G00029390 [Aldrovandia affinis]|uniref:Uncharacterized protein n=1 Tax=Aldrovandia affinis TaxID=143900 RepID=A0AAD7S4B5_9TELE|nr:hypothetical protein AAFF_G00029390 [Aldrovandia affinis]